MLFLKWICKILEHSRMVANQVNCFSFWSFCLQFFTYRYKGQTCGHKAALCGVQATVILLFQEASFSFYLWSGLDLWKWPSVGSQWSSVLAPPQIPRKVWWHHHQGVKVHSKFCTVLSQFIKQASRFPSKLNKGQISIFQYMMTYLNQQRATTEKWSNMFCVVKELAFNSSQGNFWLVRPLIRLRIPFVGILWCDVFFFFSEKKFFSTNQKCSLFSSKMNHFLKTFGYLKNVNLVFNAVFCFIYCYSKSQQQMQIVFVRI